MIGLTLIGVTLFNAGVFVGPALTVIGTALMIPAMVLAFRSLA